MKSTLASRRIARIVTAAVVGAVAAASLAACSGGTSSGGGSASDIDAALKQGGTITYWSWTPSAEAQVAAFEKEYPKVKVKLVNAGTNTTEYTKLQNAIKAGTRAPPTSRRSSTTPSRSSLSPTPSSTSSSTASTSFRTTTPPAPGAR